MRQTYKFLIYLYDLYDLYDLAHVAGWEPYNLHNILAVNCGMSPALDLWYYPDISCTTYVS